MGGPKNQRPKKVSPFYFLWWFILLGWLLKGRYILWGWVQTSPTKILVHSSEGFLPPSTKSKTGSVIFALVSNRRFCGNSAGGLMFDLPIKQSSAGTSAGPHQLLRKDLLHQMLSTSSKQGVSPQEVTGETGNKGSQRLIHQRDPGIGGTVEVDWSS